MEFNHNLLENKMSYAPSPSRKIVFLRNCFKKKKLLPAYKDIKRGHGQFQSVKGEAAWAPFGLSMTQVKKNKILHF